MVRYDYEQFRLALGKRIRELRKQRGMTHRVMVTQHGFHLTQIARIERGKPISMPTLLRIAEVFDVPVGLLIADIGEVQVDEQQQTPEAEPNATKGTKIPKSKTSKK